MNFGELDFWLYLYVCDAHIKKERTLQRVQNNYRGHMHEH